MFGKKNVIHPNQLDTLVGEGTKIDGNIISKASLRIEGHVNGDIKTTGDLTIGASAVLHSNINARQVINAGMIHGSITCQESLKITASGQVFGTIQTKALEVADGGVFQGTSKMEPRRERDTEKNSSPGKESLASGEKEKMHLVKS